MAEIIAIVGLSFAVGVSVGYVLCWIAFVRPLAKNLDRLEAQTND